MKEPFIVIPDPRLMPKAEAHSALYFAATSDSKVGTAQVHEFMFSVSGLCSRYWIAMLIGLALQAMPTLG